MGVCDNGKLVGVLRIEDLLSAPPEARVSDIMDVAPLWSRPEWTRRKLPGKQCNMVKVRWRSSMKQGALSALFRGSSASRAASRA